MSKQTNRQCGSPISETPLDSSESATPAPTDISSHVARERDPDNFDAGGPEETRTRSDRAVLSTDAPEIVADSSTWSDPGRLVVDRATAPFEPLVNSLPS